MGALRDYEQWHRAYDDPASSLSWRLRTVQGHIRRVLDEQTGPVRILSACAGDGRDVLEVLSLWSRGRGDRDLSADIRARFAAAHFLEDDFATLDAGSRPAVGAVRYEGPATELIAGRRLFSFVR